MSHLTALYLRIWRAYFAWARALIPLAVIVFVPLGLVHAIPVHLDLTDLDLQGGAKLVLAGVAVFLLAATGLIGEIFYTGAVAIALTHPHDGHPPTAREVARLVNYRTLIAVDLSFGALVAVGLLLFFVPGVLAFVYFGLAAPVAEIERLRFRRAFSRSFELVRGHFWLVFLTLVPIELASDAVTNLATGLGHGLLGDSLAAEWLTDTLSNVILTPFYAVAAVLLCLDLISDRDGRAPDLHSPPVAG